MLRSLSIKFIFHHRVWPIVFFKTLSNYISWISYTINFLNFDTCQNNYDLKHLLKLATRIQNRIKIVHDADIKNSLKKDLKIVKAQIGNQVLDTPNDKKIFSPNKITHYSDTNSPNQSHPVKRISNSNKYAIFDFSDDDLAAKFSFYLEQRKKQQDENVFFGKANKKTQVNLDKRKMKKKSQTEL